MINSRRCVRKNRTPRDGPHGERCRQTHECIDNAGPEEIQRFRVAVGATRPTCEHRVPLGLLGQNMASRVLSVGRIMKMRIAIMAPLRFWGRLFWFPSGYTATVLRACVVRFELS